MMRFPYLLVTFVNAWAISRWNVAVALHKPNGILLHCNNPSWHAKPVFSRSCFLSGTCQTAEPKSNVVKNFAAPQLGEALIVTGNRICVFYRHCVQVAENTTKHELSPFFLAMTTPQAHGTSTARSSRTPLTSRFLSCTLLTYVGSFSSPLPYEEPSPLLYQSRVLQHCSNLCRPFALK